MGSIRALSDRASVSIDCGRADESWKRSVQGWPWTLPLLVLAGSAAGQADVVGWGTDVVFAP
jgi:hypothetical protein